MRSIVIGTPIYEALNYVAVLLFLSMLRVITYEFVAILLKLRVNLFPVL